MAEIVKSGYMGVVETVKNDYLGETDLFNEHDQKAYNKRRYRTIKEKARNMRRNIILEMIMSDPTRKWSSYEIAREAKKLPWFQEHMPTYSHMTAWKDYLVIKQETRTRREELAEDVLVRQLDEIEDQRNSILDDLSELGSLEEFKNSIPPPDINEIAQFTKTKNTLLNALDRLYQKESKLVPVDMPKKLEVSQMRINLDVYRQIRDEVQGEISGSNHQQLEDGIVEGQFTDKD